MRRRPEPAWAGHVTGSRVRSFRALCFCRAGFSVAWVAVVAALGLSAASGGTPGILAVVLLGCYPASDAAATVFDQQANRTASPRWPQQVNLAADVAAAGGILIALLSGLAPAITVFGIWAVVSGTIMAGLAIRRHQVLRGQWLMLISGVGSVVAGISFIGWTGTPGTGLAALAQYSAGGALWYLLAGILLLRSPARSSARAAGQPSRDSVFRSGEGVDPAFQAAALCGDEPGIVQGVGEQGDSLIGGD